MTDLDQAARWMADCVNRPAPFVAGLPAALKPRTVEEGYALQDLVSQRLSETGRGQTIGWKVGSTTAAMQGLLGVPEPAAGRMFESSLIAAGSTVRHDHYRRPAVECEVAVRLARPLDARRHPVTLAQVRDAIGSVHPAIELVDDRYGDFAAVGAPLMIADQFFHAGLLLGAAVPDALDLDFAALQGATWVNGEQRLTGKGSDVLGHPFQSIVWLAQHLASRGHRLEAGEIVTTGSLPLPYWAQAGDRVRIRIEHLGEVGIQFSA